MNQNASPLLSVRDLRVAHAAPDGLRPALNGIDFDLYPGEIVSLIGESGSGKSTLASTILGVLPETSHTEGSITLGGHELVGLDERGYQRLRGSTIALVPQDPGTSLDPLATIGRQLTEVFAIHGIGRGRADRRRRAIELLESVGVDRPEHRLRQYPHQLSGGLKQRVLIAIGFALRPQLLIADEPTSALDVTVQHKVLTVFEQLARETGTSVLFITHDIAVATDHAARALVLYQGDIVESGTIEQIVTSPRTDYTRTLLGVADGHGEQLSPVGSSAPVAVRTAGLTKTYGGGRRAQESIVAVDDVSLTIRQGTTFALVGESGSGKTTAARSLLGLVHPEAGHVEIDGIGVDLRRRGRRQELWQHIQYVHQNPWLSLDPRLTVERTLTEPLRGLSTLPKERWHERIGEVLDQVALPHDVLVRRAAELSGGQRQRVVLARVLLGGARVLVLDEVLSALDVVTQQQVLDLLARLQRELGLTYIFISHDLSVVRDIAHDVAVLYRGQVVETGSTREVFDHPHHPYTRELLASVPGRRIAELRGQAHDFAASAS